MSLMAYLIGGTITLFAIVVSVFVYESAVSGDLMNEETPLKVIISMVFASCWFIFIPIATLIGLAYVVTKLIIVCRDKWRNK